jgi:hypothetical protein
MRVKLLILIMLLIACGLQAQKFNFASRRWDTTVLDDSDTIALFHFDEDYSDLSGNVWSLYQDKSYTPKITTGARFGAGYLHDNINIYPQGWYLNASDTSVFDVGTGDYTVEFWMRLEGSYFGTVVGAVHPLFYFEMDGSYLLRVDYYPVSYAPFNQITYLLNYSGDSLSNFALPYAISPGTWHHICFERYAGTVGVYINGVLQATKSGSALGNADLSPTTVRIGRGDTVSLIGRFSMDEYRVSKVARHQLTSFTPETKAFGRWREARVYLAESAIDETSIDDSTVSMLHLDSDYTDLATGATWLADGAWYVAQPSGSNWTIDSGAAKFGDGGIKDDAQPASNWGVLTSEMPSKFWFGSGDFTLEWWIRVEELTTHTGVVNILDFFTQKDASNYWQCYTRIGPNSPTDFSIYMGVATLSGGSWVDIRQVNGNVTSVGQWVHFACVRESGTITLYIDGVPRLSFATASAQYVYNMTEAANVSIQRVYNGASTFDGVINIDEFRASNIARYSGAFTPPTEPFGVSTTSRLNF